LPGPTMIAVFPMRFAWTAADTPAEVLP